MAEGKKSFIVYTSWKMWLDGLTKEQKGIWLDWMMDYCNDLNPDYPQDQAVMIACMMAKDTLKRDLKKYELKVKSIENARNQRKQNDINMKSNRNQSDINSVNVNVNDNVNVNVSKDTNNINRSSKLDRYADLRKQILDYLNDSIGSHYRDCKANKRLIDSRLDDGYTLEDFKHVIDVKSYQWKDSDLQKYLRPETLFCASHFESYLNEEKQTGVKNNPFDLPDAGFRSL